jgi:hypothetical protein
MAWAGSDALLLTGVLVLSLLPLGLSLLDVLASRGGSLEYAGLKIDFAAVIKSAPSVTLAPNIGVPGVPVPDSASASILDTLRTAVANDIVVVDLGDGRAWWETRLLVLSSGGARLGRPHPLSRVSCTGLRLSPTKPIDSCIRFSRGMYLLVRALPMCGPPLLP